MLIQHTSLVAVDAARLELPTADSKISNSQIFLPTFKQV